MRRSAGSDVSCRRSQASSRTIVNYSVDRDVAGDRQRTMSAGHCMAAHFHDRLHVPYGRCRSVPANRRARTQRIEREIRVAAPVGNHHSRTTIDIDEPLKRDDHEFRRLPAPIGVRGVRFTGGAIRRVRVGRRAQGVWWMKRLKLEPPIRTASCRARVRRWW